MSQSVKLCIMCGDEHLWHLDFCDRCYRENRIIANHNRMSALNGSASDLTLEQWLQTLDVFKWHCAYCIRKPYQVLEHFIPNTLGGGTTITNCVPACRSCNDLKRNLHPDCVTHIPKPVLERIRVFLSLQNSSKYTL